MAVSGEYTDEAHQALRALLGEDIATARATLASLHGARAFLPTATVVIYDDGSVGITVDMTPGEVASAVESLARLLAMVGGLRGASVMLAGFMGADADFGATDETSEP